MTEADAKASGLMVRGFASKEEHQAALVASGISYLSGLQKIALRPRERHNDPDAAAQAQRDTIKAAVQVAIAAALDAGASVLETRPLVELLNAFDRLENGGDPPIFEKPKGKDGGRYSIAALDASRREAVVLLVEIYRQDYRRRTGKKMTVNDAATRAAAKLAGYNPAELFDAYSRDTEGRKFFTDKLEAKTIKGYRGEIVNGPEWPRLKRLLAKVALWPLEQAEKAALLWATSGESELDHVRQLLKETEPGEVISETRVSPQPSAPLAEP